MASSPPLVDWISKTSSLQQHHTSKVRDGLENFLKNCREKVGMSNNNSSDYSNTSSSTIANMWLLATSSSASASAAATGTGTGTTTTTAAAAAMTTNNANTTTPVKTPASASASSLPKPVRSNYFDSSGYAQPSPLKGNAFKSTSYSTNGSINNNNNNNNPRWSTSPINEVVTPPLSPIPSEMVGSTQRVIMFSDPGHHHNHSNSSHTNSNHSNSNNNNNINSNSSNAIHRGYNNNNNNYNYHPSLASAASSSASHEQKYSDPDWKKIDFSAASSMQANRNIANQHELEVASLMSAVQQKDSALNHLTNAMEELKTSNLEKEAVIATMSRELEDIRATKYRLGTERLQQQSSEVEMLYRFESEAAKSICNQQEKMIFQLTENERILRSQIEQKTQRIQELEASVAGMMELLEHNDARVGNEVQVLAAELGHLKAVVHSSARDYRDTATAAGPAAVHVIRSAIKEKDDKIDQLSALLAQMGGELKVKDMVMNKQLAEVEGSIKEQQVELRVKEASMNHQIEELGQYQKQLAVRENEIEKKEKALIDKSTELLEQQRQQIEEQFLTKEKATIDKMNQKLEAMRQECEDAKDSLHSKNKEIGELRSALSKLDGSHKSTATEIDRLLAEIAEKEDQVSQERKKNKSLTKQITGLKDTVRELQENNDQVVTLESNIKSLQRERDKLKAEVAELKKTNEEINESLSEVQNQASAAKSELFGCNKTLREAQRDIQRLEEEVAEKQQELTTTRQEKTKIGRQVEQLNVEIRDLHQKLEEMEANLKTTTLAHKQDTAKLQKSTNDNQQLKLQISQLEESENAAKNLLINAQRELKETQDRLAELKASSSEKIAKLTRRCEENEVQLQQAIHLEQSARKEARSARTELGELKVELGKSNEMIEHLEREIKTDKLAFDTTSKERSPPTVSLVTPTTANVPRMDLLNSYGSQPTTTPLQSELLLPFDAAAPSTARTSFSSSSGNNSNNRPHLLTSLWNDEGQQQQQQQQSSVPMQVSNLLLQQQDAQQQQQQQQPRFKSRRMSTMPLSTTSTDLLNDSSSTSSNLSSTRFKSRKLSMASVSSSKGL